MTETYTLESESPVRDLGRAALSQWKFWFAGAFVAATFWYALNEPAAAISAMSVEVVLAGIAVAVLGRAVWQTGERTDALDQF